jgi:hypothetical protein
MECQLLGFSLFSLDCAFVAREWFMRVVVQDFDRKGREYWLARVS